MKLYDTHSHINMGELKDNVENIYKECKNKNMLCNVVGTNLEDSILAIEIAKKYNDIFYAIVGIHPNDVEELEYQEIDNLINKLDLLIKENIKYIVGVGETGLDFYRSSKGSEKQYYSLKKHLELSNKYNLPLVLHVREAHNEMIEFIKNNKFNSNIIIHCFTGNKNIAKEYNKLGCYISYSGIITFNNALDILESINYVDLDKIIVETDCP